MIRITNTPNLTGVTISGDFEDLDALVEAIYQVTISEFDEDLNKKSRRYLNISLRALGLAYDVRHAAQGDREVFTEANGLPEWYAEAAAEAGRSLPEANLRYLEMSREARAKKLVTITRRLAEHHLDRENLQYRHAIDEAIEEHGWDESNLRFEGLGYPAEIQW